MVEIQLQSFLEVGLRTFVETYIRHVASLAFKKLAEYTFKDSFEPEDDSDTDKYLTAPQRNRYNERENGASDPSTVDEASSNNFPSQNEVQDDIENGGQGDSNTLDQERRATESSNPDSVARNVCPPGPEEERSESGIGSVEQDGSRSPNEPPTEQESGAVESIDPGRAASQVRPAGQAKIQTEGDVENDPQDDTRNSNEVFGGPRDIDAAGTRKASTSLPLQMPLYDKVSNVTTISGFTNIARTRNMPPGVAVTNKTNLFLRPQMKKVPLTERAFTRDDEPSKVSLVQPVGDDGVDEPFERQELSSLVEEISEEGPATTVPIPIVSEIAQVVTFKTDSTTDPLMFAITARGCYVTTPYCKLYCPPKCVERTIDVKMWPEYYPQEVLSEGGIFITPFVHFSSTSNAEIEFEKDVELSIYSSYSAINSRNPVNVKLIKKTRNGIKRTDVSTLLLPLRNAEDKFVTFKLRTFCGNAGHVSRDQLAFTNRRYYSAAYLRGGGQRDLAVLHFLLYDDMDVVTQHNMEYLREKNVVLYPECITIAYPYKLFIQINGGQSATLQPKDYMVPLASFYNTKIDEKYCFGLNWKAERDSSLVTLSYQLNLVGGEGRRVLFKHKPFFVGPNSHEQR